MACPSPSPFLPRPTIPLPLVLSNPRLVALPDSSVQSRLVGGTANCRHLTPQTSATNFAIALRYSFLF